MSAHGEALPPEEYPIGTPASSEKSAAPSASSADRSAAPPTSAGGPFKDPRDKTPKQTKAERLAAEGAFTRNKKLNIEMWEDLDSVMRRVEAGEKTVMTRFFMVDHDPGRRMISSSGNTKGDGMSRALTMSMYCRGESPTSYLLEAVQAQMFGDQQEPFKTVADMRAFIASANN